MKVDKIEDDVWYTRQEVCELLDIHVTTLHQKKYIERMPEQRKIDMNKNGKIRKWRVKGEGIKKFILGIDSGSNKTEKQSNDDVR